MKTLATFLLFLLLGISITISAQDQKANISAKIESIFIEGILKLKASATNNSTNYHELNYLFVSIKKGSSGNLSNNKQSGKFTLNPEETKQLSELNINIQKNDAIKIFLYIKDEQTQKLITKDSLEINGKKFQNKLSNVKEDDIFELKGLTIDETKTKVGKDFYDIFYLEYSKLPEKFGNAVTIAELPSVGRSTQISIAIEDKTIYSFMSNPSDDFLKEQANLTMRMLMDYQQKKSLIKNEFRY